MNLGQYKRIYFQGYIKAGEPLIKFVIFLSKTNMYNETLYKLNQLSVAKFSLIALIKSGSTDLSMQLKTV